MNHLGISGIELARRFKERNPKIGCNPRGPKRILVGYPNDMHISEALESAEMIGADIAGPDDSHGVNFHQRCLPSISEVRRMIMRNPAQRADIAITAHVS